MLTPQQLDADLERINDQGGIVAISGKVRPSHQIQIERRISSIVSLRFSITLALSSLATIDDVANNRIDINSMMTAMDDYIQRSISGGDDVGVPIN